jgi:NAD(P)-dependent dehydrogenase (short-subunit alcohol dehydrogenase family)
MLINCAGVLMPGDLESQFPAQYDLMVDVNLRAPVLLTSLFSD